MRKAGDLGNALRGMGVRGILLRLIALIGGWWALTAGESSAMSFGAVVVVLGVASSLALPPAARPPRWRPLGWLRFALFFVAGSLRGGADVALRALLPGRPLRPAMIPFQSSLPPGPALNLFMSVVSLMPGSISVDRDGQDLQIHVLVDSPGVSLALRALEARVHDVLDTAPQAGSTSG